ncbi:MAG TPA: glutaminyl-peptide cyclotransferase [Sphingomonadaceae bacterium]|nr:glutaminyl-peptide cyclotransferase [Sphingomonadaceae bacterium]
MLKARITFAGAAFLSALLPAPASADLPVARYRIERVYPHDSGAFTEGLFYRDGFLYESTGLEGQSDIRKVRLEDGMVLQRVMLPKNLFGEGIVDWKNEIVSLTWQTGIGFRWSLAGFRRRGQFRYAGEGWGMTRNDRDLVMSDGTPVLRFLDPVTLRVRRRLTVTAEGRPLNDINELEWVKGEILANIWKTDLIARIDPATGRVKGWIDLTGLRQRAARPGIDSVANGIAYDRVRDRLFVTGKNWRSLFEISLVPAR